MTEAQPIADIDAAPIGPGRLVLVVGPSGAGKDTLIDLARAACVNDDRVAFPRRIVTREASAAERNTQVTPDEFAQALTRNEFAVHWDAHGLRYALSREIDDDIRAGRTVVANVSRQVIGAVRQAYVDVVVVAITAPLDVLAGRLAVRGRISDGRSQDRLNRTINGIDAAPDIVINNVGKAEDHVRELIAVIKGD